MTRFIISGHFGIVIDADTEEEAMRRFDHGEYPESDLVLDMGYEIEEDGVQNE